MTAQSQLILIKLGGSLITDKAGTEAPCSQVLRRLANELREVVKEGRSRILLGHGSGSFGHAAASSGGWRADSAAPELETLARTQDAAGRLHREVIAALREVGLDPFSLAPGSMMTCRRGRLATLAIEPLVAALAAGLLPVTFGDVVLDTEEHARIFSTERVFLSLTPALLARGYEIGGAYWLGTTDGILDSTGLPVGDVDRDNAEAILSTLSAGDAGEGVRDVTGGMRHRLDTAIALARMGVSSRILDGRPEGALRRAVAGEVSGTLVSVGA